MKKLDASFKKITPLGSIKSLDFEDFVVTGFEQPATHSISWHAHEMPILLFVFDGAVDEIFRRQTFECRSSSLLVRPGGETHAHSYGSTGANCLAAQIKPTWLKADRQVLRVFDSVLYDRKSSLAGLGRKLQRELEVGDEVSLFAIESILLEIVVGLNRKQKYSHNSSTPKWLEDARDLIHGHFKEKLSLKSVSETIGIHPSHLAEMFHLKFGYTLGEYIRNLRLEYAFREIRETQKTISEIAVASGFYDQSHFTKRFKERFRQTPKAARVDSKNHSRYQ